MVGDRSFFSKEGVHPLQREYRLRKRADFRRVFQLGKSFANRQFVVIVCPRQTPGPARVGVSVSRKVGKAVVRNRVRRLVKEAVRGWIRELPEKTDLVIVARTPAAQMDFHQIRSSLQHVFHKAKLFQVRTSSDAGRGGTA
jgi:ribonuclease P protein component